MHEIPVTKRLGGLIGKELIQVCIGSHQVIFNFEDDVQISVESSMEHEVANGKVHRYNDYWKQESSLTTLLGSSVNRIRTVDTKTLSFVFSNGESIRLSVDSDNYESFQFRIGDEFIVV